MPSLRKIHREMGETGHLGEFFFGLGLFIFIGSLVMIVWGRLTQTAGQATAVDAASTGWLFLVAGAGIMVFGAYVMFSGWGRHHPRFEHGGDPDVADRYDAEGESAGR